MLALAQSVHRISGVAGYLTVALAKLLKLGMLSGLVPLFPSHKRTSLSAVAPRIYLDSEKS